MEARIVADREEAIVEAVQALSGALRFRLHERRHRPDARRHHRRFGRQGVRPADRRRPARGRPPAAVLEGPRHRAERKRGCAWRAFRRARRLIPNSVSAAPGFVVKNVFVMAGVPSIMQAMMDEVVKMLPAARPVLERDDRGASRRGRHRGAGGGGAEGVSERPDRLLSLSRRHDASRRGWCCARATKDSWRRRGERWKRRSRGFE